MADPCARYRDPTTFARCHLFSSADGWRYIPEAGRRADLDTQLRCAALRADANAYERCVSERDEVAARLSLAQRARGQELARTWQPRLAARSEGESPAYAVVGAREPPPVQRRDGPNPFQAEIERRTNREAQQLLADLGYVLGPIDGVMGARTRAAIRAFQAGVGLPVDGQISDELIAVLRDAAASGQRVVAGPTPAQPRLDGTRPWERYGVAAPATPQRRLDSTGSGFAVSQDGQIVTNHHLVANCAEVRVRPAWQEAVAGAVVARDPGNDLALLRVPTCLPAAVLRDNRGIRAGDSVVAVGFALHGLLASEANVGTGAVSALAGIGNDTRFLQMTVPVQPGNSGGPLLDLQGRVVGVVVGKLDALKVASITGDIPQNVNFAIKVGVLRSFLDASGIVSESPHETLPESSATEVAARAKAFTVLVECWK